MANTSKSMTQLDANQAIRSAFSDEDKTLTVGPFIQSKAGNKVLKTNTSSTVEQYSYYDGSTLLYIVEVEYTDSSKNDLVRIERL